MRLLLIIFFFCMATVAQAQAPIVVGSYDSTDMNLFRGSLQINKTVKLTQYGTGLSAGDTVLFYITNDKTLRVLPLSYVRGSGGSGGDADSNIFNTNYRADTSRQAIYLLLNNLSESTLALLDSIFSLRGGIELNTAGISYNRGRIEALSDSAKAAADSINAAKIIIAGKIPYDDTSVSTGVASKHYVNTAIAAIPADTVPSLQATANVDRHVDSVLVSKNIYIGTTTNRKPGVLHIGGDSQDAAVSGGIAASRIWPQLLADMLGYTLDNTFALPSTFLMNESPYYNPLDDTSSLMYLVENDLIPDVSADTGTKHIFVISRGINDLHWYTKYDSGYNYNPVNYGRDLRIIVAHLEAKGYVVIIMGPKYASPTNPMVTYDSISRWRDTARQVAADYNIPFFDAFAWGFSHGKSNLLSVDSFHYNETGHRQNVAGMLYTLGYQVERNGQKLAVNGTVEFNDIIYRPTDTATDESVPLLLNRGGHIVAAPNILIKNVGPSDNAQAASLNVKEVKGAQIIGTGLGGVSFSIGNNTAFRNSAASNGTSYFDASGNLTGQFVFRMLPAQVTFNSSGITTAANIQANIVRAVTAIQGAALANGTLYHDPSQNTTGWHIFRGDSITFSLPLWVSTTFKIGTNGKILKYGNSWSFPAKSILGGDGGPDLELITIAEGKGATVNQTGTTITIGADTTHLDNTYFKQGGNQFPDTFQMGNYAWYQLWKGSSNGDMFILNGAGNNWRFRIVQNANDTVFTIDRQNRFHLGSYTTDRGRKVQMHGSVWAKDTVIIDNIPKRATVPDSTVGIVNGLFVAYPTGTGGGGGDLAWSDTTGSTGLTTQYRLDTAYNGLYNLTWTLNSNILDSIAAHSAMMAIIQDSIDNYHTRISANTSAIAGKQDALGFTAENVANKTTSFGIVNDDLYPSVEAVTEYVSAGIAALSSVYVSLSGSYANPSWLTALAWSKITGTPTTVAGYGIVDGATIGVTVNTQSGTTYTILSSDNGKIIEFTNSSAVTVTLPSGLGTTFTCIIRQNGTGDVTLATSGTTVNNANSHTSTRAQYSAFAILPTGTSNTYITQGDMD